MAAQIPAQTQAELEAATASANVAEQLKKAAQSRKETAAANLEATKLVAESEKAKVELDTSRLTLLKSGLPASPDVKKYLPEKPSAPVLNATIDRLTFEQVDKMATKFSDEIRKSLDAKPDKPRPVLVFDSNKVRALLAVEQAVREGMISVEKRVGNSVDALRAKLAVQPTATLAPDGPRPAMAPGSLLLISSIVENVMAYAAILKTQWGFATASTSSNAEATLLPLVQSRLMADATIIEPDAALALSNAPSALLGHLAAIRTVIDDARKTVSDAASKSQAIRSAVLHNNEPSSVTAQSELSRHADDIDHLALATATEADEADKFLSTLLTLDTQGTSLIDSAQRGEALRSSLGGSAPIYTLVIKVVASDADTVVTDRLFSGLKIYIGTTILAQWKLIDAGGVIRGINASMTSASPHQIALTELKS
jgi:hypothetical protein